MNSKVYSLLDAMSEENESIHCLTTTGCTAVLEDGTTDLLLLRRLHNIFSLNKKYDFRLHK